MTDISDYQLLAISESIHLEWPAMLFVLIVFLTTLYLMNSLLFRPILNQAEKKEALIAKKNKDAFSVMENLEKKESEYQINKKEAFEKLNNERDALLRKSREEAFEMVSKARLDANNAIMANDEALTANMNGIKESCGSQVTELKKLIMAQLVKS